MIVRRGSTIIDYHGPFDQQIQLDPCHGFITVLIRIFTTADEFDRLKFHTKIETLGKRWKPEKPSGIMNESAGPVHTYTLSE